MTAAHRLVHDYPSGLETDTTPLEQHALSSAFPAMTSEDFLVLKDSIEVVGVQNPITLFEGMVIDGWHRYRAATELGMPCAMRELEDVDPRHFVLAQNKARRNVTAAQMALATTAVYSWYPAHRPDKSALSADLSRSTSELAAIAGVGTRTIEQAKAIRDNATPEVRAAVKAGEIGLPKAAAIAKMPKGEQSAAIKKPMGKRLRDKELKAAAPAGPTEAEKCAEMAHGGTSLEQLLDETLAELGVARGQLAAAEADDAKAEAMKWRRLTDIARNRQNELMATVNEREAEIKRHVKSLRRIGVAVGEEDPGRVASAVEALVRKWTAT